MIERLPDSVQTAWGDDAVRDFTTWLEAVMAEQTVSPKTWDQAAAQINDLEARFTEMEGRLINVESGLHDVDKRLAVVESHLSELKIDIRTLQTDVHDRLDRMGASFDARLDNLGDRFDSLHEQMAVQMRWTVGVLALFGTIIAVLVGIGQLMG